MKGLFSILAVGLLAVDGVLAANCRPSKPASSVSSVSSASSASSISSAPSVSPSSVSSTPSSSSASSVSSVSAAPSASHSACSNWVVDGSFTNHLIGWDLSYTGDSATWTTQDCSPTCAHCAELEATGSGSTTITMSQDITLTPDTMYVIIFTYYKEQDGTTDGNPTFDCQLASAQSTTGQIPSRRRRNARDLGLTSPASPLFRKRVGVAAPEGVSLVERRALAGRGAVAPQFSSNIHWFTTTGADNTVTCTMVSNGPSIYEVGEVVVIPAACPL